jgi:hypothetical protein
MAEGYDVVGFDIERHHYGDHRYPAQLVIQDVLTLHGSQFRDATLIVASPPCQAYSYRAMPWKRAKALPPPDNTLFEACFRIQREASEAAGRHVPMVVENVRGAQKWVGRARWNFGSFYLWGDVPALMPMTLRVADRKQQGSCAAWFDKALDERRKEATRIKNSCIDFNGYGTSGTKPYTAAEIAHDKEASGKGRNPDGRKQPGIDLSQVGFNCANAREFGHMVEGAQYRRTEDDKRQHIGKTRKFASAMIAKIPEPLARHIARTYKSTQPTGEPP